MICGIYSFEKTSTASRGELHTHPKFYFFDAGVYRTLRPSGPLDEADVIPGAALEAFVFQELRALNHYWNLGYDIFFWRTTAGLEVDFILYGKQGLKAFEVKASRKVDRADLRGLLEFRKDYPMAECTLFYGGLIRREIDGISVVPLTEGVHKAFVK